MDEKKQKDLQVKITDNQRFSLIFMFLGAFLYIGTLVPFDGKTIFKSEVLMFSSLGAIIIALVFYQQMRKAKKKLNSF
ncbi:YrhC-like protein [Scopulibacillus darangshiensis]|uniref:YrhC-like protein n=1 Tax=Scopulibacillus darangshiensis TaxID=442528 RepID=A0A4R2PDW2_9BACL|nr:YrhC family protein [Scopulibacillus darangshiensis]TCP32301.1 YrhC-like protein [Scopulibacillus darangshiensis]